MSNLKRHENACTDETELKINGDNGWLWVIATNSSVGYWIAGTYSTRGKAVTLGLLSGYKGIIIHDDWKPYSFISTASRQLDLLHVDRWIERAEVRHGIEPEPLFGGRPPILTRRGCLPREFIAFVDGVRNIFSSAVHASDEPEKSRRRAFTVVRGKLSALLAVRWKDRDAAHIAAELRRRFGVLFTFLQQCNVP